MLINRSTVGMNDFIDQGNGKIHVDSFTNPKRSETSGPNACSIGYWNFKTYYDILWNIVFLDYKKKDLPIIVVVYDEKEGHDKVFEMSLAELMMHMCFWYPFARFSNDMHKQFKITTDFVWYFQGKDKDGNDYGLDSKHFEKYLTKVALYFIDKIPESRESIDNWSAILSKTIDMFSEIVNSYCAYTCNSISLYDIHELAKRNPVFKQCIETHLDESKSSIEIERQVDEGSKQVLDAIKADGQSVLVDYITGGRFSKTQFGQMFYAVGERCDVDKTIQPHLMRSNYLNGAERPSECYMEAVTGRDAQILKKVTVRESGYLSRKINLACLNTHIDYNVEDCGTTHYINFKVEDANDLKSIDLKYMIDDSGRKVLIHSDKMKYLIGTTIKLRSHIFCALNGNRVCKTCFGEKSKRLIGTNIGALPSICIANPVSKLLMKAKHFTSATASEISNEAIYKYFTVSEKALYFKNERKNANTFIVIPKDIVDEIATSYEISTDTENYVTQLDSFKIIDGDNEYEIENEGLSLCITDSFYNVLMEHKKIIDEEDVKIPTTELEPDSSQFKTIVVTEAVQLYLKKIKHIIDTSLTTSFTSVDDFLNSFMKILQDMGVSSLSITNVETLIYQLIRDPDDLTSRPKNFDHYKIVRLSTAIQNMDIYTAFAFEKFKAEVTNVDSFKKSSVGIFSPLFRTTPPIYVRQFDPEALAVVGIR